MFALILLCGLVAVTLGGGCVGGMRRQRWWRSGILGMGSVLSAGCATLLVATDLHLRTYRRLGDQSTIAAIAFRQESPDRYEATLTLGQAQAPRRYRLYGQDWQIDARVLKWPPTFHWLGMRAGYRFERISGRYHQIDDERSKPRSVYDLGGEAAGLDLWRLAQRHPQWFPFIDATYGSAAYVPMADGAAYDIRITASGLIAVPTNDEAGEAVRRW